MGWKIRSSTWVLQLITLATIQTIKSQLEIHTIHIIKESHLRLLENDGRQKKNGSMDHLLTAELWIWDNLKKNNLTAIRIAQPQQNLTQY